MNPLQLAIIIDLLMLIPFVDFIITIPLQLILWSKPEVDNDALKYLNITYDAVADFIIPVFGDMVPLNTISVIAVICYEKIR